MSAAEHRFWLHSTMGDSGITHAEHLQAIAEQTGDYSELEGPDMPEIVTHVWEWFLELSSARSEGGISYSEIKAWLELTGRSISPFELTLIKKLDILFLTKDKDG